jgi:hypothetical protein
MFEILKDDRKEPLCSLLNETSKIKKSVAEGASSSLKMLDPWN